MDALMISELFLFALGLSADAFAVAVCRGLAAGRVTVKQMLTVGVWFGGFQALMPTIGYFLGIHARELIEDYDHWIAFILLFAIGANMIRESFAQGGEDAGAVDASFSFGSMFILAVATSIDALAVGIAMAMSHRYEIAPAAAMIGVVTFVLSGAGLFLGSVFGEKYKKPATVAGGVILIFLAVFILGEHLWW